MKQALLRKGSVTVQEVPPPVHGSGEILVEVTRSLISTGTEMASVRGSERSVLANARNKPGALQKAIESIRVRGIRKTLAHVRNQMDASSALGYSCAGRVLSVGDAVDGFRRGDRVACAGAGLANHAEIVSVPANLCVRVPVGVSDRAAAFVTIGAIALQGVRRADVRLGENICIMGLGLIGQVTVQLLVAAGCNVIGMDLDAARVELARKHGMRDGTTSGHELARIALLGTAQKGTDATILTASTPSSEPTQLAFHITRKKGKIVVVGAVGLDLKRSPFYEKEQDFLISCSYGPGRYDSAYENEGKDYPYAFVRWTENRNMAAFLDLIDQKRVDVESLIEKEVAFDEATCAYEELSTKDGTKPLAIVLTYPAVEKPHKLVPVLRVGAPVGKSDIIRLGVIGAGNFANGMHIPNLEKMKRKVQVVGVCTRSGATAITMARRLNAALVTNDYKELLRSPEIDAVLVCTRHNNHAEIAEAALKAGKHIYLEKPLALTLEELESLDRTIRELKSRPILMVGYNRRFSPFARTLENQLSGRRTPLLVHYRVNAGTVPEGHWTQTAEGGGRLRGEACHIVDLFQFLVKQPVEHYAIESWPKASGLRPDENFAAQLVYADGSICNLIYTTVANKDLGKEWAELHWDGKSAIMDDFKILRAYGCPGSSRLDRQDKGHLEALRTFTTAVGEGFPFPTPWEQLYETTLTTIRLDREVWGRYSAQ